MNVPNIPDHDWKHSSSSSVYGKHTEDITADTPPPLGSRIVLIHYFDASLIHDISSRKAGTGTGTGTGVYKRSITCLLLTGISSSNLHRKQLHMVQSSYLEENVVRTSFTIKHTFNTWESQ